MVTLMYLKNWLKLAAITAGAVVIEWVLLHTGPWYWLALALGVTALVFVAITSALVTDWRIQRGSALYRFDTVHDRTGERW